MSDHHQQLFYNRHLGTPQPLIAWPAVRGFSLKNQYNNKIAEAFVRAAELRCHHKFIFSPFLLTYKQFTRYTQTCIASRTAQKINHSSSTSTNLLQVCNYPPQPISPTAKNHHRADFSTYQAPATKYLSLRAGIIGLGNSCTPIDFLIWPDLHKKIMHETP
ncbi:hypothetical protein CC80DRAFT_50024 [Byssothecium circinans]|uniref:Uncharacterized protein n=1 Tax=Byssothecium circinans TaxID=147558 RepID=A0A6A5TXU2_9PLEO|nr:hypothetical protein CC80DRAFT_50024 [Byssothecium circinans]